MINRLLYEEYHKNIRPQKRVINEHDFTYRNTLSVVKRYLPLKGRALDVGSATGTISFYFASKGLTVDGVELSKNAVKYANINRKRLNLRNVTFYNSPVEKLKVKQKYDLITCFEVLEHVQDDLLLLKYLSKRIKKTGTLILTVPSVNAPLHKLGLLKGFDERVGHLRRYSTKSLSKLLKSSGYRITLSYKSEGIIRSLLFTNRTLNFFIKMTKVRPVNAMINMIDKLFLKILPESQLIFVCKLK